MTSHHAQTRGYRPNPYCWHEGMRSHFVESRWDALVADRQSCSGQEAGLKHLRRCFYLQTQLRIPQPSACSRLNTGLWSARLGSWQAGHLVRLQAKESMTNRTVEFIWKINNIRVHLVNPPSLSTPFTRRDGSILTLVRFAFTFERGLRPALGANFPFSPFHTRTHALAKQSHQFVVTRLSVTSANHSADGLKKIMIIICVPDGMCTHKFSLIDHKNVNKFCCTD